MRHRTKHNISTLSTHHAEQTRNGKFSGPKKHWDVQNAYCKSIKFSTVAIYALLLLLCSMGIMYWYHAHTTTSVLEQWEDKAQDTTTESKINKSINESINENIKKKQSNEVQSKVELPFVPLRDRADVHLSQNKLVNLTSMSTQLFDELDVISFVLPPVIQKQISQIKLSSFLELGTRVAGTDREAHLQFLLRDALKQLHTAHSDHVSSHMVTSDKETVPPELSQSAWWSLEWDNFTENGPDSFDVEHINDTSSLRNPISFTNLIFTFNGGRAYIEHHATQNLREQREEEEENNKIVQNTTRTAMEHRTNTHSAERNHIVFAAHWDSKWQPIGLLGASDSAVPLLMLTRLMQNVATLSEISAQLHAIAEQEEPNQSFDEYYLENSNHSDDGDSRLIRALHQVLTPIQCHYVVEYYLGMSSNSVINVNTTDNKVNNSNISSDSNNRLNNSRLNTKKYRNKSATRYAERHFVDWIKWIDALPPISVILFDGEEAFEEWEGNDNTYGSRHLASRWQRERWELNRTFTHGSNETSHYRNKSHVSKYDSIALFVLLDLLGTRGIELHNFFPSFSGAFYKELAEIERHGRQRALQESVIMAKQFMRDSTQHPHKGNRTGLMHNMSELIEYSLLKEAMQHIPSQRKFPEIWYEYGTPHEMFTLFDFKHSEVKWLAQERAKQKLQKQEQSRREEESNEYELLLSLPFEHTYDVMQTVKVPLNTSAKWAMLQELNRNVFFSLQEATLRKWGANDAHFTGIEDDHKHWLATERVLHLIAAPFPEEWHTLADNGDNIDHGTVVDVNKILWQFVLQRGKHATREDEM